MDASQQQEYDEGVSRYTRQSLPVMAITCGATLVISYFVAAWWMILVYFGILAVNVAVYYARCLWLEGALTLDGLLKENDGVIEDY